MICIGPQSKSSDKTDAYFQNDSEVCIGQMRHRLEQQYFCYFELELFFCEAANAEPSPMREILSNAYGSPQYLPNFDQSPFEHRG